MRATTAYAKAKKHTDSVALNGVPVNYPQVVGGKWQIYDPVAGAYTDTGIYARGTKIQVNATSGNWETSEDDGATWADTGLPAQGIQGERGNDGANGETPQFQVSGNTLQYKFAAQSPHTWTDLYTFTNTGQLQSSLAETDDTKPGFVKEKLLAHLSYDNTQVAVNPLTANNGQTAIDELTERSNATQDSLTDEIKLSITHYTDNVHTDGATPVGQDESGNDFIITNPKQAYRVGWNANGKIVQAQQLANQNMDGSSPIALTTKQYVDGREVFCQFCQSLSGRVDCSLLGNVNKEYTIAGRSDTGEVMWRRKVYATGDSVFIGVNFADIPPGTTHFVLAKGMFETGQIIYDNDVLIRFNHSQSLLATAAQVDAVQNKVDNLENLGHQAGRFATHADMPNNVSGYAPIVPTVNDFVYVNADETQGGKEVRYGILSIDGSGVITYDSGYVIVVDQSGKMNVVPTAAEDNFVAFDQNGNSKDSGKNAGSFVTPADLSDEAAALMALINGKTSGIATTYDNSQTGYTSLAEWFQNYAGEKSGVWQFPQNWADLPVQNEPYIMLIFRGDSNLAGSRIYSIIAFNRSGNMRTDRGTYVESTGALTWTYIVTERINLVSVLDYDNLMQQNLPLMRLVAIKTASAYYWVYRFSSGTFIYFGAALDTTENPGKPAMVSGLIGSGGKQEMRYPTFEQIENLDYSAEEQDTGQKWVNGKIVYQKTFTGNIVGAVSTNIHTVLMSGVDEVISIDGWFMTGDDANKKSIHLSNPAYALAYVYVVAGSGAVALLTNCVNARAGTTNNAYAVTLRYTKL
jgi:hypothetical protein